MIYGIENKINATHGKCDCFKHLIKWIIIIRQVHGYTKLQEHWQDVSGFPRHGDNCAGGIGPRHGVGFPAGLYAPLLSWSDEKASPSLVQPRNGDASHNPRRRCRIVTQTCSFSRIDSFRVRQASSLPKWFTTVESHGISSLSSIYCPSVLKGVLPSVLYDHFMLLHTAIKLLSSAETCFRFNSSSKDLLHHFIRKSPKLYGGHFITFNSHCLIHLPADVSRYGPLDYFSCFPFENFLYQLKKLIRHSASPLVQLFKRLIEMSNCWDILIWKQFWFLCSWSSAIWSPFGLTITSWGSLLQFPPVSQCSVPPMEFLYSPPKLFCNH